MSLALAYQRVFASLNAAAVARLRGLEQFDGDGDVVVQQAGQRGAGRVAVVRLEGVADVGLVLQQARRGGVEPARSIRECHNR